MYHYFVAYRRFVANHAKWGPQYRHESVIHHSSWPIETTDQLRELESTFGAGRDEPDLKIVNLTLLSAGK